MLPLYWNCFLWQCFMGQTCCLWKISLEDFGETLVTWQWILQNLCHFQAYFWHFASSTLLWLSVLSSTSLQGSLFCILLLHTSVVLSLDSECVPCPFSCKFIRTRLLVMGVLYQSICSHTATYVVHSLNWQKMLLTKNVARGKNTLDIKRFFFQEPLSVLNMGKSHCVLNLSNRNSRTTP